MSIKKNLSVLENINLDLFYSVRAYAYEIQLQGDCKKETIQYLKEKFGIEFEYSQNHNWLTADFFASGIKINITLTIS